MIGEMMACGSTLREAISCSLQTDKETLESVLISLHLAKGFVERGESEYILFTEDVLAKRKALKPKLSSLGSSEVG